MKSMIEPSEDGKDKLVFTEDLKNMTFLMSDKQEEIDLLKEMIRRFNSQNKDLRFGSFIFGPVVMRLLHNFKKSDVALELLNDPACAGFFDQMTSYTILADMLFENKNYEQVLDIYESVKAKGIFDAKFPRDLITAYMASAYLLGSKEAFERTKSLVHNVRSEGGFLTSRSISFFAALALKHNDPDASFEALSVLRILAPLPRNLKLIAQCRLNRADDALLSLRSYLCDEGLRKKDDILKETIDIITKSVTDMQKQELITECEQIVRSLSEKNHVSARTLEELLLEPINLFRRREFIPGTGGGFRNEQDDRRGFGNRPQSGYTDRGFDNRRQRFDQPFNQRNRVTPVYERRGLREME